jgi:hypothetical protein
MPLINFKPTYKFPAHSQIAATRALHVQTYGINPSMASQPNTASINFIGAIVNNITGNVLEYQHLIKSNTHKDGITALPTISATYSRVSETSKAPIPAFSLQKTKCLGTNKPHTDAFAATIILKKMYHIALNSPSAATE